MTNLKKVKKSKIETGSRVKNFAPNLKPRQQKPSSFTVEICPYPNYSYLVPLDGSNTRSIRLDKSISSGKKSKNWAVTTRKTKQTFLPVI